MNTNEHDSDPRERISRLLVATLLGEATPGEAAEVERALEASPELRAERERLAATIGLVRGLGGGAEEHLSPEVTRALTAAAASKRAAPAARPEGGRILRGPWASSGVFRAAATVAVALGALALWRAGQDMRAPAERQLASSYEVSDELAAGRTTVASAPEAKREGKDARGALEGEASARPRGQAAFDTEVPLAEGEREGTYRGPGDSVPPAKPEPTALTRRLEQADAGEPQVAGQPVESAGIALAASEPARPDASEQLALVTLERAAPAPGRDDFYRGLPALEAAPAPPGAAGPSSPGPVASAPVDAPATISLGARWEGRYGGRAGGKGQAPAAEAPVRENLRGLGYVGGAAAGTDESVARLGRLAPGEEALHDDISVDEAQGAAVARRLRALVYADADEVVSEEQELREDLVGLRPARSRFDEDYRYAQRLTPEQRAAAIDALLAACRRGPNERPRDMFFRYWGDNPFELTRLDRLSTFSIDVDTASYALARRYLAEGRLPEKAQIRTEEFVNYFKGDVPPPTEGTFAVATELAPSLFNASSDTWMLRVAVRGKEVTKTQRMPLALTFVVDVSGSMKEQNRLELVKHALRLLVAELDARDAVSIVAFTNDARLVLPMTSAAQRGLIESAIHPLQPQGGTNVEAGLRMGYEAARAGLAAEAFNRVVLLSDGVGNLGETDAARLNEAVQRQRDDGIYLNTVGVGMNNHNDAFLEQLANTGDGICNYVDDEQEARRALVENFTGAFEPIARDVKIQVEFDPAQVERYRLLGYENRAIADADFRNDAVDAGEVGAGHQVVALYEVMRTGGADAEAPLATVRLRWQPPLRALVSNQFEELPAQELEHAVRAREAAGSFGATSAGYRRSALVAQLAEFLRRSIHAREDSFEALLSEARRLAPELADPDFDEFVRMVERAIELLGAEWGQYDALARRLDALRMHHYQRAQLEELDADVDAGRIEELEQQRRALEDEIRRLLEARRVR